MTTDTKPTPKQVATLKSCLDSREEAVKLMMVYHRKRVEFFEQCNLFLNTTNALVGIGALSFIGWQLAEQTDAVFSVKTSLVPATATVFLLFFGMLFDLTRKEEKHRWLESSYSRLNQKISNIYFSVWKNLTAREYEKLADLFEQIRNDMIVLKTEEPPILQFELFLADQRRNIIGDDETELILKVTRWQFWLASLFSMTDVLTKFLAKHNDQKRQEWQQQQKNKEKKS